MNAAEVERQIAAMRPELEALGVRRLLLVGSVARGEERPDSDVDLVVEFAGPAKFLPYMSVAELLEKKLGRRIDLTTLKALRPEVARRVLAEARRVA